MDWELILFVLLPSLAVVPLAYLGIEWVYRDKKNSK